MPRGGWWDRPARVLLVNLREGDEPRIDAQALVDEVASFGATAFCISGGGILAFYRTRIPGHRTSRALGERDLLAEVMPVARARGLRVLARIDASCAPKAFAQHHPEWFTRDPDGNFCEVSDHYVTCPNAGYYREHILAVVRELIGNYDVDGIWNNQGKFAAWDTGPCHCGTCVRLFRAEAGAAIPVQENWSDPLWRRFNEWRYRRIADWVAHMHRSIHAMKRDAVFISANQVMEPLETTRPGGWDIDYWAPSLDIPAFECQRRNSVPWWPGFQAKYLATLAPEKPRWMTVSYFYPWWRLYASPEAENRSFVAQQFASGTSSWLHINGGYSALFDRRRLAAMREVFQRLARWERYFDGARSAARVALVYSRHSADNYAGARTQGGYHDFVRGAYMALQEAHVPFDVLSDKLIDEARLAGYRTLMLPNTACLPDAALAAVARFVEGGGGLVTGFDAGTRTVEGDVRPQWPLGPVLGVERTGRRTDLKSSYAKLGGRDDPLLAGLGDTDLVANDGDLVEVRAAPGRHVPLTLIPPVRAYDGATISIPDLSGAVEETDVPVAVRGVFGRGRTVYFANPVEMLFYRYGFEDLGRIIANAVRWTLADDDLIAVDAPPFVEATLMRQPGRLLVHLVNFPVGKHLNPGWRHPGHTLVAVDGIAIRIRLPAGATLAGARLASDESALATVVTDEGWTTLTVPHLHDHEIVVLELTS
jgi:hypothetical protein